MWKQSWTEALSALDTPDVIEMLQELKECAPTVAKGSGAADGAPSVMPDEAALRVDHIIQIAQSDPKLLPVLGEQLDAAIRSPSDLKSSLNAAYEAEGEPVLEKLLSLVRSLHCAHCAFTLPSLLCLHCAHCAFTLPSLLGLHCAHCAFTALTVPALRLHCACTVSSLCLNYAHCACTVPSLCSLCCC